MFIHFYTWAVLRCWESCVKFLQDMIHSFKEKIENSVIKSYFNHSIFWIISIFSSFFVGGIRFGQIRFSWTQKEGNRGIDVTVQAKRAQVKKLQSEAAEEDQGPTWQTSAHRKLVQKFCHGSLGFPILYSVVPDGMDFIWISYGFMISQCTELILHYFACLQVLLVLPRLHSESQSLENAAQAADETLPKIAVDGLCLSCNVLNMARSFAALENLLQNGPKVQLDIIEESEAAHDSRWMEWCIDFHLMSPFLLNCCETLTHKTYYTGRWIHSQKAVSSEYLRVADGLNWFSRTWCLVMGTPCHNCGQ